MSNLYPHFSEEEFLACTPSCSGLQMNKRFMDVLEQVRTWSGVPMKLTSAFRSQDYEHSKGRSGNSWHCLGMAVDIACTNAVSRYKIIDAAIKFGITGIGVASNYIHLDLRDTANKIWVY